MIALRQTLFKLLRWLLLQVALVAPARLRNWLLLWPYRSVRRSIAPARRDPQGAQRRALSTIVRRNRATEFGRSHGFDQIDDVQDYRRRVPVRGYRELLPFIERQQAGETEVLFAGPLAGLTVDAAHGRLFPVSEDALAHWSWIARAARQVAFERYPDTTVGHWVELLPLYLRTDDEPQPSLLQTLLARRRQQPRLVPLELYSVADEEVRYYLLLRLLIGQPVAVLQAASPGTLAVLAEHLQRQGPRLLDELAAGSISHLERVDPTLRRLLPQPVPDRRRAEHLRQRLAQHGRLRPRDLWPRLGLLVCPTAGPARHAAERLADHYDGLPLMDPGIRSAAAISTWPWFSGEAGRLVLEGQYWEFSPPDDRDTILGPDQLRVGQRYRPLLTGPNGLYRFEMELELQVVDLSDGIPQVMVSGRQQQQVPLEEGFLRENDIAEVTGTACRETGLSLLGFTSWLDEPAEPETSVLLQEKRGLLGRLRRRPETPTTGAPPALTWALEPSVQVESDRHGRLLKVLERTMQRRCAVYRRARETGKLGQARVLLLAPGALARRSRQRIVAGLPDAHHPLPALLEDSWAMQDDEVAAIIDEAGE